MLALRGMRALLAVAAVVVALPRSCKRESPEAAEAPAPSASAPAVDPTVTFARRPLSVGARSVAVCDLSSKSTLTIDPGRGRRAILRELGVASSTRFTEETLAARGDAVVKQKTTFDKFEVRTTDATTSKVKPNRLAGKTYVIEARDGAISARDEKGKPAPRDDAAELDKLYKSSLGKPDPIASAVPPVLRPGDVVEPLARGLAALLDGSEVSVSNARVVFKEKQGDDGLFTVAFKLTQENDRVLMLMDLAGELRISTKTSSLVKLDASGRVTVLTSPQAKPGPSFAGSGTAALHLTDEGL